MLGLFSARCPIGPRERVWVERGTARLLDVCGIDWLRQTPVLTGDELVDLLAVEPVEAAAVAERLAPQFPFALSGIEWHEEADISGQQAVEYVPGNPAIGLVPQQLNQSPLLRTAHVARCLCEHALSTQLAPARTGLHLPLGVDLLCVLAGIGLFPANSTVMTKYWQDGLLHWTIRQFQSFMPSRIYGYALALRCWLCEEAAVPWSSLMRPDARGPFEAGLKFLKKRRPVSWDESRDILRSFRDPPNVDDVRRLLRHRDSAVQISALDDVADFGLDDEQICHEIGHLVHDPSGEVREEAIRTIALMPTGSDELGEALTIFCDDPTPRIRSLAALALGEVLHPPASAVETLRGLTEDAEPSVSSAAAESLVGFPEGLTEVRSRVFQILRQQLARCNYAAVDRFVQRLQASVADAGGLVEQEFVGAEEAPWRQILLQSLKALDSKKGNDQPNPPGDLRGSGDVSG